MSYPSTALYERAQGERVLIYFPFVVSMNAVNSRTMNTSPFDFAQGERVLIYFPFVVSMIMSLSNENSRTMTLFYFLANSLSRLLANICRSR